MLQHHKDPGRFNPALRNRQVALDTARLEAWIEEHAPEGKATDFLTTMMHTVRDYVGVLGTALDEGNPAVAGQTVNLLSTLAAKTGARQLERDCRLIQASLNAGRLERARRLWHRLHCDVAILEEALDQLHAGTDWLPGQGGPDDASRVRAEFHGPASGTRLFPIILIGAERQKEAHHDS